MNLTQTPAESPQQSKVWEKKCHRCWKVTTPRCGLRANITGDDGRERMKFICRECVTELGGAWRALVAHAEAHEQHLAAERERTGRSLERAA